MRVWRLTTAFFLAASVAALQACSWGCDDATVGRAAAFIDAHQACATDDDCVVISDACGEIPGGNCGQLTMNRNGAESAEWVSLARELDDCASDSCTVCTAALVPTCTNGTCR